MAKIGSYGVHFSTADDDRDEPLDGPVYLATALRPADTKPVWPAYTGVQVNMLPFLLSAAESLPDTVRAYYPLIEMCLKHQTEEKVRHADRSLSPKKTKRWEGSVGYLSVWESEVAAGEAQRRPGLHTEATRDPRMMNTSQEAHQAEGSGDASAGGVDDGGKNGVDEDTEFSRGKGTSECFEEFRWGSGKGARLTSDMCGDISFEQGIYQGSTVSDTCVAYDARMATVGVHGDCEDQRDTLDENVERRSFAAHAIFWMTDRTPHESLPMGTAGRRQWYRLVMPEIDVWYSQHSTANTFSGIVPPSTVRIATHDKFQRPGSLTKSARKVNAPKSGAVAAGAGGSDAAGT